jgi:hypothetical protein
MKGFVMNRLGTLAFALALGAPLGARAADEETAKQLAAMQARMEQLEDKLSATNDQLSAAQQKLAAQESQLQLVPTEAVDASSGIAPFLDTINVSGFMAATWFYNLNSPSSSDLQGANLPVDLLHPDANSFSLDELWLTVSRDVSPEQRAGFKAEFVYGKTASILSGNNNDGFAGNDFDLYQGYISYLAPLGDGVTVSAGKFATLLGAEVASSKDNWNITRGNVYNYLQPINHTGVLASTPIGPVTTTFGVVDETRAFPARNADRNNNKALLFGVSGGGETFSGSFAGTYGDSPFSNNSSNNELILDFIGRWNPTASLSTYVNADYISTDVNGAADSVDGYGIAGAARFAFNETTGLAGRFEYLSLEDDLNNDLKIWELTGTLDHKLTDALTLRGEVRYDSASEADLLTGAGDDLYTGDDGPFDDDSQVTLGVEVLYGF